MLRRFVCLMCLAVSLFGCAGMSEMGDTGAQITQAAGFNPQQLVKAIKEALQLSATRASDNLAQADAYQGDTPYFIDLPPALIEARKTLQRLGMGSALDKVETSMNRAAQLAAAEAKTVLVAAVASMEINDALGIVRGGKTAATDYFRATTELTLTDRYRGIVKQQLQKVSFYPTYESVLQIYKTLPIRNKPQLDLEELVVQRSLNSLYLEIAEQEKKIRANPVEQGSLLISSVFGLK